MTEHVKLIGPVIFIMALILFPATGTDQVTFRVDGYVYDSETGNPLYAIVVIEGTKSGAVCDEKGHFSLEVADTGPFMLKVSMISYEERRFGVRVPLKKALLILLAPQPINIAEVSVTSSTIIDKYSSSERAITKRTSYISQGGVPVENDNVLSGVLDLSSEDKVSGNQLPARRRTRFGRRVHRAQNPERKIIRPRQCQLHGHEIVLQSQSTPAGHDRPAFLQRVLPQTYAGYRGAQSVCSRPVGG